MQKFSEFVNQYKDYKMKESSTKVITRGELKLLRESYESINSGKVKSDKVDEYKAEVNKFREWKKAHGKGTDVSPADMKKIREMVDKRNGGKKLEEKKEAGNNPASFKAFVNKYREWKCVKKGTSRLTEKEKANLQRMFFNENKQEKPEGKVDARLEETMNGYKSWKKASHGTDVLTESEKAVIARSFKIESINTKLNEAKSLVKSARTKLQEGDAMIDGAADVNQAGAALNDANAMANDVLATDPATPLPENITNGILEVKNSIDALAASAGIASPVENPVNMDANPAAGVEGVMDTNLDPNAAPVADPNAVPMAESKKPNAEGKEKLNEAKSDPAEKDLVTQPSTADLLSGYPKSGVAKPAQTWPTEPPKPEPKKKGLGNIEESQEETQEQKDARAVLAEDGSFSWSNFLKMKRERA